MGHRITRAASYLSVDEVKEHMNTDTRPWVRHHWWIIYNRVFPSLEPLIDVLCQGLCDLADDAERLRSLTNFPHLKITF